MWRSEEGAHQLSVFKEVSPRDSPAESASSARPARQMWLVAQPRLPRRGRRSKHGSLDLVRRRISGFHDRLLLDGSPPQKQATAPEPGVLQRLVPRHLC